MMTILADTAAAAPDPMISGNWLIAILGALSTAAAALIGKNRVDAAKREATNTTIDGQPLTISLVETLATKEEMKELEGRLVTELKKLENAMTSERSVARVANGNLHARIDKSAESLAEMKGQLSQISANTDRLIDMAMHTKPRTIR